MTSKGRGSKDPDQKRRTGRAASKAKKLSLPAFGFAEDLLKEKQSGAGETEAAGEAAAGEAAAAPVVAAAAPVVGDKDRIFTFADTLDAGAEVERAAPVRLESWVTLSLAGEIFALPVEPVHEVLRVADITRVPHAPHPIRGVTNLRGRVIPVIDLCRRIELPEGEITRRSRIIVVGSRGRLIGLLVDAVHQVAHLDPSQVQTPPEDVMTVQSDYISGVYHMGEELILLLDVDRALIVREAPGGEAVRQEAFQESGAV
ncbi:MAG: chemotaxis protein CheW [bacterium]|nr:chemotaxis protein CheW [bacterium]